MENSFIRDIGTLINTYPQANRNGLIQTIYDETDLQKSRIQNLPSYKKDDLSKRLDMVVIFQAMQIQRLSIQIQSLRVELKDSQRQIANYLSYQIQIKQLNENSLRLERENGKFEKEIIKINGICQKMYVEISEGNRKNGELEEEVRKLREKVRGYQMEFKGKELNILKLEREIQAFKAGKNKDDISKPIMSNQTEPRYSHVKQNSQILRNSQNSLNQIQKNQPILNNLLTEINRLKSIELNFRRQYDRLINQINEKTQTIENLKVVIKNRIGQIQDEKSKPRQEEMLINGKIQEIQRRFREFNEKAEKENVGLERDNVKLLDNLSSISKENDQLRLQLVRLGQESKQKCELFEQKVKDLQSKLNETQSERQKLINLIEKKQKLMQEIERKSKQQTQVFEKQLNNLVKNKKEIDRKLQSLLKSSDEKCAELEKLQKNLQNLSEQDQRRNKQQQKVKQDFSQKLQMYQKVHIKLVQQKQKSFNLQNKLVDIEFVCKKLQQIIQEKENQKKLVYNQLENIKKQIKQIKLEVVGLNEKIKQNQSKYKAEIEKMREEVGRCERTIAQKNQELEKVRISYKRLVEQNQKQKNQNFKKVSQLKQTNQKNANTLQTYLQQLQLSSKTIKQIKQTHTNIIQNHQHSNDQLFKKINQLFKINDNFAEKIINLQTSIGLLQNENLKLQTQNRLLNFQMVETHKLNSMQKRRTDRTQTSSSSLKSFKNVSLSSFSVIKNGNQTNRSNIYGSFLRSNNNKTSTQQFLQSQRAILSELSNKRLA